jgi:hypothetical protein
MVYVVQSYWACFGLYPSSCMWKTMDRVQNKPNSSVLILFAESQITPSLSHLGSFVVHATVSSCSHDLGIKQAVGAVKSLTEPRSHTKLFRILNLDRLMEKLYAQ